METHFPRRIRLNKYTPPLHTLCKHPQSQTYLPKPQPSCQRKKLCIAIPLLKKKGEKMLPESKFGD